MSLGVVYLSVSSWLQVRWIISELHSFGKKRVHFRFKLNKKMLMVIEDITADDERRGGQRKQMESALDAIGPTRMLFADPLNLQALARSFLTRLHSVDQGDGQVKKAIFGPEQR
jgi:hypothetical protein